MTSGIGMQLFRRESDILVDVLTTLKAKGVVALPDPRCCPHHG